MRDEAAQKRYADFIQTRLAPANPPNDGKQTSMRGHPVFKAQHACACCSALASLGVFASPRVANPRKGRLRDAEAAEISPERSERRRRLNAGYKVRDETADAEGIWLHRRVARTPQGPQGAGRMEADYE
jgi:hypothetical protein